MNPKPSRPWISVQDRRPTADDADVYGCVEVWHIWQGVMIMGWHQVDNNRFVTHWMPTPDPPENHKKLRETWEKEMEKRYGNAADIKR